MNRKKKSGQRILSVLLALLLVSTICNPVLAATARATTMKLEKTEGKVSLRTQNGTARKISQGMRLYNGNSLETGKTSYAYISLDSSKAVKLDENSKVSLRQNGKKLELLVKSGELFFDVSTKLKDDESMDIRTSTMVTGIRGTCGIVEVVSSEVSKLYLLEGEVSLGGNNPVTVYGGQIATVESVTSQDKDVTVADMAETDIPIFAIEEVLKDPILQEKIEKTTDFSVEKMEDYLEQSQENPEKPAEPVTPQEPIAPVEPVTPSTPETPTEPEEPAEPTEPETPTEPEEPAEPASSVELTGTVSAASLQEALDANDTVVLTEDSKVTLSATDSISVPAGKKLQVESQIKGSETTGYSGGLYMVKGSRMTLEQGAELVVSGMFYGLGTIEAGDTNGGASVEVTSGGGLVAETINLKAGNIANKGTIDIGEMRSTGNSSIVNQTLIKINRGYTSDIPGSDRYEGSSESVLISNQESTAMLEKEQLAYGYTKGDTDTNVQFYYADGLNTRVAEYMNKVKSDTKQSEDVDIWWNFTKNAVVEAGDEVTLTNLNAVMNENELQVAGSLTLTDIGTITGNGEAVIRLKTGGQLTLDSNDSSADTVRILKNEAQSKYVIAVEEEESEQMKSLITWKDTRLLIQTEGQNVTYTIQGVKQEETGTASNSCMTLPEGYLLLWDDRGTLSLTQ